MDIRIGAIIFIVFIIISIAQKIKERAEIARAQRQRPQSKPGEMPAEARRNIYSEDAPVRVATPKGVPPREEPVAPARQLMEALFGVERVEVEEEAADAAWAPAAPAPRPELPRRVPPPPPPVRRQVVAQHVESRVQHEPVHEGATTREESIGLQQAQKARQRQLEAQQRAPQQRAREASTGQPRGRQEGPRRRKARQVRRTPPPRRYKRERLFRGAHEVRKAIVFAEILGPPKAFKDR